MLFDSIVVKKIYLILLWCKLLILNFFFCVKVMLFFCIILYDGVLFRIKIKFFGRVFLLVVVSCRLDILRILFFFINNLFISIEGGLLFIGCMLILKYCLRIWFLLEF